MSRCYGWFCPKECWFCLNEYGDASKLQRAAGDSWHVRSMTILVLPLHPLPTNRSLINPLGPNSLPFRFLGIRVKGMLTYSSAVLKGLPLLEPQFRFGEKLLSTRVKLSPQRAPVLGEIIPVSYTHLTLPTIYTV